MAPQPQSKPSKAWMIVAIIAIIAALGVGGYLAYSIVTSNQKISDLQADIDQKQKTIAELQADDDADGTNELFESSNIDFEDIYKVVRSEIGDDSKDFLVSLNSGGYLKRSINGNYQIVKFGIEETVDGQTVAAGSRTAILYRLVPDGKWIYSGFSGSEPLVPDCEGLSDEEISIFEGIVNCPEQE